MNADHIYPVFDRLLSREAKEERLGQRARVIWLVGLSGSGKSTLAASLERQLFSDGHLVHVLDGDNVRTGLNRGLGFSDEDRAENIRRIAEVSKLFVQAGIITINSFITPRESFRAMAREIIGPGDLTEVWVDCSYETCRERDVKGLYAKAEAGQVAQFTGRESEFEPPHAADLILNTDREAAEESLRRLYEFVKPLVRRKET